MAAAHNLPPDVEQQFTAAIFAKLRSGEEISVELIAEMFDLSPDVACKTFVLALAIIRALALTEQLALARTRH